MTDATLRAGEAGVQEQMPLDPAGSDEDFEVNLVSLNQWQIAWRRFKRHRLAVFGSLLFLAICLVAIIGPFIIPFNFYELPPPQAHCPGDPKSLWSNGCPPSP